MIADIFVNILNTFCKNAVSIIRNNEPSQVRIDWELDAISFSLFDA